MQAGEREKRRGQVLLALEELAGSRVNDAVKLAFLSDEDMPLIDRLDLTALAEFRRGDKGTEVKLIDRAGILEKLDALLERGDGADFFTALSACAAQEDEGL